jgi:phosphoribosylglycinamide formyltransferase 2
VTDALGGSGLFGVEFFIAGREVYFSELSPRPHDTGLVTLTSQNFSEFDLHLRAVLGLPIPEISYNGPSASAVILADRESTDFTFTGVDEAMKIKSADVRLFGKPSSRPYRRMGVALARGRTTDEARKKARQAAGKVKIIYR